MYPGGRVLLTPEARASWGIRPVQSTAGYFSPSPPGVCFEGNRPATGARRSSSGAPGRSAGSTQHLGEVSGPAPGFGALYSSLLVQGACQAAAKGLPAPAAARLRRASLASLLPSRLRRPEPAPAPIAAAAVAGSRRGRAEGSGGRGRGRGRSLASGEKIERRPRRLSGVATRLGDPGSTG